MAKGMTKRALQQKRKRQAVEKAQKLAWLPKRHNRKNIEYPSTFLDLARELRDMVYAPLLTGTGRQIMWLSMSYSDLAPSTESQKILDEFSQLSLVSRQVGREAEEALVRVNEFNVCFNVSALVPIYPINLARRFVPSQAASIISRLRSITILDHAVIDLSYPEDDLRDAIMFAGCAYTLSHVAVKTAGTAAIEFTDRPDLHQRQEKATAILDYKSLANFQLWQEHAAEHFNGTKAVSPDQHQRQEKATSILDYTSLVNLQLWQEQAAEYFKGTKAVSRTVGQPTRYGYALQDIVGIQRKQGAFLVDLPDWWRDLCLSLWWDWLYEDFVRG